jgi:hypothetical protein
MCALEKYLLDKLNSKFGFLPLSNNSLICWEARN